MPDSSVTLAIFGPMYEYHVSDMRRQLATLEDQTPQPVDAATWLDPDAVAARLGVDPRTLRRIVASVPPDLPGAPVAVGTGSARRRLRWRADAVDEWIAAVAAYRAAPRRARKPSQARSRKPAPAPTASGGSLASFGRDLCRGR